MHAIFCYHRQDEIDAWSPDHEADVMKNLIAVEEGLRRQYAFHGVARLMPTRHAKTVRKDSVPSIVLDGPFAETKEHLLGFYLVDTGTMDEAIAIARALGDANPGGSYEVRPLMLYRP